MLRTANARQFGAGKALIVAEVEAYASQPRDAEAGIYTETLARLYLKQGFVERALAIYHRLAQEQPDNAQLHERLHTLEQELARGELGQNLWCSVLCQTPRTRPQHP